MLFVEALGRPVAFFHNFPHANAREMARQVAQPLFVSCRAPSRETRAPHGAPSRRLPYRAGPRFAGTVRCSRPGFAFWAKHTAGGRPPRARLLADGS